MLAPYSRMFSLLRYRCMEYRSTRTTLVVDKISLFSAQLAKLTNAPHASFAVLRSSIVLQRESAATTSCMAPDIPMDFLISSSTARLPMTPHASFCTPMWVVHFCMFAIANCKKPMSRILSRIVASLQGDRAMPKDAATTSPFSGCSFNNSTIFRRKPASSSDICTSVASLDSDQTALRTAANKLMAPSGSTAVPFRSWL
mmetsp:Transcript_27864/g.64322  ORF Transcript_27864/g.64322 Transcript_27864/m.64322 type:complete len:200 (-) Transcript_27864:775-1374(-)